ncbi:hypothetical protein HC031_18035 [Planosporangium thailandense]|uniref:DUF2721 domain-containing protein n=1 Tax=Planosporangium thailandense TaxID=765197 RepID=A0ABX0Y2D8_9ACTN|nr:hypothetical protein [Planosporangium thailandense]NJC71604.1 hypothetical protein [Planosporangium thailandense]
MEGFIYFVLGVLFSAVIALFSPFWTDRYRTWRASRSLRAKRERLGQLASELSQIREYQSNPSAFQAFVLERLVYIAFLSAVFAAISGLTAAMTVASEFYFLGGMSGVAAAVGALVTLPVCTRTLRIIRKVRSGRYLAELELTIAELEASLTEPSPTT